MHRHPEAQFGVVAGLHLSSLRARLSDAASGYDLGLDAAAVVP
jgi:hypothetical protein